MIYFTADTHFNHKNIIEFCERPFSDVIEMNEVIINNWNKKVKKSDTIYHLGDIGFGYIDYIIRRLNGKKILILGSHDHMVNKSLYLFEDVTPLMTLYNMKPEITLCHYAMRVWYKSHYGSWHLYGHSHGRLSPEGKSYDVGMDNNKFIPISLDEIREIMKNRPDNFNLIRKQRRI